MRGRSLLDPSALDSMHAIYALWEGDEPHLPKPKAGPLFDGARSASLMICDQWVEMLLDGGAVRRTGSVAGHTAPCEQGDWRGRMPAMLRHHLVRSGYPVAASASDVRKGEQTKTRFPGQGKRGIAHERGGWVAAVVSVAATVSM